MRRSLRALTLGLGVAVAICAHAAGKETHDYRVLAAWFDDNTLYLRYTHHYALYPAFSFEIRATPVQRRAETRIVTLPRAAVAAGSARLRLEGGDGAESIEYRDGDITLDRVGEQLRLTGRAGSTVLSACVWPYWRESGVARAPDGFFVCGAFADREGRVKAQMPLAAVTALGAKLAATNQAGPGTVATTVPVFAATISAGRLLLITDWTRNRPASLQVATLALDALDAPAPSFITTTLGAQSAYFGLRSGQRVYAPGGVFVVDTGTRAAPALAVCELDRCVPLAVPGTYAALLVDHARREAIWFGARDASQVELDVRRVTY